jgi:ABC-type multidrug transport system ATPase subunit
MQTKHALCLDLLKRFDLLGFEDKLFMQLSSGQKKKVAIICALLNDSDVFLFDEVTTSLDEKSRNTLLKYLEQIRKDKIIIWATHDNEVKNIKTQTLLISKGEINYV